MAHGQPWKVSKQSVGEFGGPLSKPTILQANQHEFRILSVSFEYSYKCCDQQKAIEKWMNHWLRALRLPQGRGAEDSTQIDYIWSCVHKGRTDDVISSKDKEVHYRRVARLMFLPIYLLINYSSLLINNIQIKRNS